ncbi:hypothetical protein [uncultured Roseibium sp.]|uniref:hypothetical protein n=1 Tax=uncultured Roseibium sp. TaxID=1936171 RepID=UPI00261D353C|nr:hypothetical protein [uncultured Roseibium sp.]
MNKSDLLRTNKRFTEAETEAEAALACAREIGDLVLEPAAMTALAELCEESERSRTLAAARNLAAQRGLSFLR